MSLQSRNVGFLTIRNVGFQGPAVSGLEVDMDELGTLTMSAKELNRLEILGRVLERRLTQSQAAEQLGSWA